MADRHERRPAGAVRATDEQDAGGDRGDEPPTRPDEQRRGDDPARRPRSSARAIGTAGSPMAERDGRRAAAPTLTAPVEHGEGDARRATASTVSTQGDRQRRLRRPARSTRRPARRSASIHQPLKPPSTSCGGPRSPAVGRCRPRLVEALAEHEPAARRRIRRPSPRGSSRPDSVTVAVGSAAARAAARSGAASTMRSTCRPVPLRASSAMRCVPGVEVERWRRRTGRRRRGRRRASSATVARNAHRQRRAVDRHEVVAAPGVDRGGHGRCCAPTESSAIAAGSTTGSA